MRIHGLRKTGVYVPEVIAEGLAPDTWEEFSKQQRRWAGSMFNLLFHYYLPELRRLPWRCKLVYLAFTTYYFRGVAFVGLLLLPFASTITGNPPVNTNVAAFCIRYIPFMFVHYGILFFLGQRFLVPNGSRKGFWFRAGLLWVAMWWDHVCALGKGMRSKKVKDRVVCAKRREMAYSPWRAIRPHLLLTMAAAGVFVWACMRPDRRETVWGSLVFLGVIVLSQSVIILQIAKTERMSRPVAQTQAVPVRAAGIPESFSPQLPKL
jgi:cellulose synthase (UDP-forming)